MKRKNQFILFTVFILLICTNFSFAETAQDAIKVLRKLEASCSIGTNLVNFKQTLVDAQLEINSYLPTQEAKSNPIVSSKINKIFGYYKLSSDVWMCKVKYNYEGICVPRDYQSNDFPDAENIMVPVFYKLKEIPFLQEALFKDDSLQRFQGDTYVIQTVMNLLWKAASDELNNMPPIPEKKEPKLKSKKK